MPSRPLRPLALVVLLAAGDYLLWNWSLSAGHGVLALIAGLTLPPLLIALVWLLVVSVGRALTGALREPRGRTATRAGRSERSRPGPAGAAVRGPSREQTEPRAAAAGEASSSSKLAA